MFSLRTAKIILFLAIVLPSIGQNAVTFDPKYLLGMKDGTTHTVSWFANTSARVIECQASTEDETVATVTSECNVEERGQLGDLTYEGQINVTAHFIGYSYLNVTLIDEFNKTIASGLMNMTVYLSYQTLNQIYTQSLAVLVAVTYLLMGAALDLSIVKGIAKKPVGPGVGIFCQYVLMPTISFGLGLLVFPQDTLLRLGLFFCGSSPGGSASNMWTHLLGGCLDLSVTMTFVSTVTAFGAIPFWVYVLGQVILADGEFSIPFWNIFVTVISLIIPCGVGILIQICLPRTVKYFKKVLTPMCIFNSLYMCTFGIYAYHYIFELFTWRMLVAGISLPCLGFLAGICMALLFRMPIAKVIAVSIETGIQNYTIGFLVLKSAFEPPASELSVGVPAAAQLLTPLPVLTLVIVKKVYECFCKTEAKQEAEDNQDFASPKQDEELPPSIGGTDNPALEP